MKYRLDQNIVLEFEEIISFKTYECEDYKGIIFFTGNKGCYQNEEYFDVTNNFNLGNRLLICDKDSIRDIPFKESTYSLLPNSIKVINE